MTMSTEERLVRAASLLDEHIERRAAAPVVCDTVSNHRKVGRVQDVADDDVTIRVETRGQIN